MSIAELMHQTSDPSVMAKWVDIIEKYAQMHSKEDYEKFYDCIYETIYGEVLSEEKAQALVKAMKPYGEVWTLTEVDNVLGGNCKRATKYYVANMMYNDYHDMFGDEMLDFYDCITNKKISKCNVEDAAQDVQLYLDVAKKIMQN